MTMLKTGDRAPQFSLPSQDGRMIRLEDYQGKRVVFWFYPRAATSG